MNRVYLVFLFIAPQFFCLFDYVETLNAESIIGGKRSLITQYPYIAAVVSDKNFCGGVIIEANFVLTSAHCVVNILTNEIKNTSIYVLTGTDNIIKDENDDAADGAYVDKIYVPKKFNVMKKYAGYDIAVLKLRTPLIINRVSTAKINIPTEKVVFNNVLATVTGYGFDKIKIVSNDPTMEPIRVGESSGWLRSAKVLVLSSEDCRKLFKRKFFAFLSYTIADIDKNVICARMIQRDRKNPEGTCGGDSGGPLVYNNEVIGLISMGPVSCSEELFPTMYTSITAHLKFIMKAKHDIIDDKIKYRILP